MRTAAIAAVKGTTARGGELGVDDKAGRMREQQMGLPIDEWENCGNSSKELLHRGPQREAGRNKSS